MLLTRNRLGISSFKAFTRSLNTKTNRGIQKRFSQEDFDKAHHAEINARIKQLATNNPDPLSPLKKGFKAVAVGFVLASVSALGYGAYDKAYRKTLQTTYPFAAYILDIFMGKEEECIVDTHSSFEQASIFRNELKSNLKD